MDRNNRRSMSGVVIKCQDSKTASVLVETLKMHPQYKKTIRVSKKYLVDIENKEVNVNDKVVITSCRRLSKRKSWRVESIIDSNKG
jgi:small subunit ribosomal protein S17